MKLNECGEPDYYDNPYLLRCRTGGVKLLDTQTMSTVQQEKKEAKKEQ